MKDYKIIFFIYFNSNNNLNDKDLFQEFKKNDLKINKKIKEYNYNYKVSSKLNLNERIGNAKKMYWL